MGIHALKRASTEDDGFTLAELIVAMGLLSIFMAIFTGATMLMTNTTTKVQRISGAVTQADQAFIAVDKSIRYATAISQPQLSTTGTWHVEYNSSVVTNGVAKDVCTQLRIANRQFQSRIWAPSGSSYVSGTLTPWRILANYVTNGSAPATLAANATTDDRPFVLPDNTKVAAASQFQRLTVTVIAAGDDTNTTETNRASATFAAVNSVAGNAASVCQQVPVDVAS